MTLDTYILRPFQVDVVRKLLVEYHVERRLLFLAIESPALWRLFEYLDPKSVNALTMVNTIRACDGARNGAMDEHNDALPRTGTMDSWVYRS